jgi:hypothetical protein
LEAADRLASLKSEYLEGGNVSTEEEQEGLQLVESYKEEVALAKENLQKGGYTLERLE